MIRSYPRAAVVAACAGVLVVAVVAPASAHQHRHVTGFETAVGWLEEPAYAGFRNAVYIRIEREVGGAAAGGEHSHTDGNTRPVEKASLQVEVLFGDETSTDKTEPMPLEPAFDEPGVFTAFIIPTRPGTYTFHIFGTVGNKAFDEFYTSGEAGANPDSEGTYNDVREPKEAQFPQQDPSAADLDSEVDAAIVAANDADGKAGTATILAIIAIIVAVLSGIAGMSFGKKKVTP